MTKFTKGQIPYNKGIKLPEQSGDKHPRWKGGKNRFPNCLICNKKLSLITASRCAKHKYTKELISKLSNIKKGKIQNQANAYLGEKAKYRAKHMWIAKHYGKAKKCIECKTEKGRIEWANISSKYYRDISDWQQMCKKCHSTFDKEKRKKHYV